MILIGEWLKDEISKMDNKSIKKFLGDSLKITPRSFFTKSASSSSNYHPYFSNVEGGLLNGHVQFMWLIAKSLCCLYNLSKDETECVFVAVILHDAFKYYSSNGKECPFTQKNHALIAYENLNKIKMDDENNNKIKERILKCVRYHMQQWSSPKSEIPYAMEAAKDIMVRIVQEADYLSSRREIADFVVKETKNTCLEK